MKALQGSLDGAVPDPPETEYIPPEDADKCPKCRGRGFTIEPDGGAGMARRCECSITNRRERNLAGFAAPSRYRGATVDNFRVDVGPAEARRALLAAKAKAVAYIDNFIAGEPGRPFRDTGLIFVGPPGTGKTHLACAIVWEIIRRYNVHALFLHFSEFLVEVRRTYDKDERMSTSEVIDKAIRAEVLVFDELGAQKPSEHTLEILTLVVNGRYVAQRPTLFTSNYALDAADPVYDKTSLRARLSTPLVSRICAMAHEVRFGDFDFRQEVERHFTAP